MNATEQRAPELQQPEGYPRTAPSERDAYPGDLSLTRKEAFQSTVDELETENERLREQLESSAGDASLQPLEDYESFLDDPAIHEAIKKGKCVDQTSPRYIKGVIASIVDAGGAVPYEDVAQLLDLATTGEVSKAASVLEERQIIEKDQRDDGMYVDLNTDGLNEVREAAARRQKTEKLMDEL